MNTLLTNGTVYFDHEWRNADLLITDDNLFVFDDKHMIDLPNPDRSFSCDGKIILPGFTDVHVHFREPGYSYKETIRTGTDAALRGGYTCVCTMPNLNPVPSTIDGLKAQLDLIRADSRIRILPYGAITIRQDGRSELSDMEALAPFVCGFTDDGKGIQDKGLMRAAMETAAALGKPIAAHCEDEKLLGGTSIHDGIYAESIGHTGISSRSEWAQIERDIRLADDTGCAYHVCHISTKEAVEIIRDAKKSNLDVTCETGPHYLTLSDKDLLGLDPRLPENGRFKMNPPIRGEADQKALLIGLADGTVDMIATDHAPHSTEEKSRGILNSAFGIVGLETSFPVLYTHLVKTGFLTAEGLADKMSGAPRRRFNLPGLPELSYGKNPLTGNASADLTVIDPRARCRIDPKSFVGKGRATPFDGWTVNGNVVMTIAGGEIRFQA